jgi:transcriptional regulator with XRE-family HTH domain
MYYEVMTKSRSIVADRIEELLRIKEMSVADLSRASGVTEGAISNILSGVRKQPRSDTVQKIAKGFPTSMDYLNGQSDNHEPSDAPILPEYAAEVVEAMRKSDRARNYELWLIAKSFAGENEQIRQLTREEFVDMLLDFGDELGTPEDTNRVMALLQRLERKWRGLGDDGLPPLGEPGKPGN